MPTLHHANGLSIDCPAKLNLTLAVGPPREDGLHPLASVMVALNFGDALSLNTIDAGPSRFTRSWHTDAPRTQAIDWPIEKDLISRAHALMQKAVGKSLPIECGLDKQIPAGAGLGGGSSDAAGMLVGLRDLFDLPLPDGRLVELGLTLGADVGFLVHALLGQRAAVVTGIGDIITPIDTLDALDVVLIFPEGQCPTAQVYSEFDRSSRPTQAADLDDYAARWAKAAALPKPINDLAAAASRICPAIEHAKARLTEMGLAAHLTGSGSTLFALADNQAQAKHLAREAQGAGLTALASSFRPVR